MSAEGQDHLSGAARGRCPERPSKPSAAHASRREGSTPSPLRASSAAAPPRAGGALPAEVLAQPLTIGTAGHVDHGKTALVAALTGVDTDRLPEEKARGLSIALGYAPLRLPCGRRVSLVDVPGHERFVSTMVAGATGVDAFLMTVAADDGVMPQTVEHAEVLSALGVGDGVVAVTKCDLADPARALGEAVELLPGCEAIACSARTGEGVERLAAALDRLSARLASRASLGGAALLHVDRVFTVAGRGTVATGTLWSGAIAVEDTLELVPRGSAVRVRAVEVHGEAVASAAAGQRVAVNLRGVKPEDVHRGEVLARPGLVKERSVLDCALRLSGPLRKGERVQVHHGTRHAPARLRELEDGVWRVRLERPLLACEGDRVVVRRQAPPKTLGGGVVLGAWPGRRPGRRSRDAASRNRGGRLQPPRAGAGVSSPLTPPPLDGALLERVEQRLREAGLALVSEAQIWDALGSPARPGSAAAALRALREDGRAVRVSGRLYAHAASVAEARRQIAALIERDGHATLAGTRDALGIGRKAAQALLEHLDAERVTRRLADDRRVMAR